jgi:hypothetical protein
MSEMRLILIQAFVILPLATTLNLEFCKAAGFLNRSYMLPLSMFSDVSGAGVDADCRAELWPLFDEPARL